MQTSGAAVKRGVGGRSCADLLARFEGVTILTVGFRWTTALESNNTTPLI